MLYDCTLMEKKKLNYVSKEIWSLFHLYRKMWNTQKMKKALSIKKC